MYEEVIGLGWLGLCFNFLFVIFVIFCFVFISMHVCARYLTIVQLFIFIWMIFVGYD